MNSRVSWSVEGIDPSVRERAEAAARQAGMSLSEWLNSTLGNSAPANFRNAPGSAADAAEPGIPRRRRHPPAARFNHPPDRTDFAPGAAQRRTAVPMLPVATHPVWCAPQRRRPRRAGRRPAIERRDLASRRAAVADFKPFAGETNPASGQAAPGRVGRARRSPGLSPLAADQPGIARCRDRGNHCAPERTR